MDKNEKKRIKNLWEDGINFQPLLLESSAYEGVSFHSANKPIPFFGMETERKITSKEKNFCYTIRHIYIFSIERRKVIRHTKAKKFKKANAALHKIIRCLNKYDYKTEAVIHSRIKSNVLRFCPYYKIKVNKDEEGLFFVVCVGLIQMIMRLKSEQMSTRQTT